jgi:16S rRNA (cytosine1402-N4)-methyltransferase
MPYHVPVLVQEVLSALQVKPGGSYVDCTVGEGGHASAILEAASPGGRLLGIDMDLQALKTAERVLWSYRDSSVLVNENFRDLEQVAERHGFTPVDGILFDLGLSSLQLQGGGRGFSFRTEEPLDMRFDNRQELTAWDVVNEYSSEELARVLSTYGEERRSNRIAQAIVYSRPIDTSLRLAQVVQRATRRPLGRIHPATRTFQAIRIEVNRELDNLESVLGQAVSLLKAGGKLVVISYHSLEDRIVKLFLRYADRKARTLHRDNIRIIPPSKEEVRTNPRSRSARLRVAERILEGDNPSTDPSTGMGVRSPEY